MKCRCFRQDNLLYVIGCNSDLHFEKLVHAQTARLLPTAESTQQRWKILRKNTKGFKKKHSFCLFLHAFSPSMFSSLVVFHPSICHPRPASAPSKGSHFKIEHFSSASLGAQTCCLKFVSLGTTDIFTSESRTVDTPRHRHVDVHFIVLLFVALGYLRLSVSAMIQRAPVQFISFTCSVFCFFFIIFKLPGSLP